MEKTHRTIKIWRSIKMKIYWYFTENKEWLGKTLIFYLPVETLSTQDNAKLLPQLKSGFKHSINCNKYQ